MYSINKEADMEELIIIELVQYITILLAFAILYENFWLKNEASKSLGVEIITGLVLGGIGIVLMLTTWTLIPGVVIDGRSVMLSISGLFFGPIPTITAMLLTGTLSIMIGGDDIWMGIAIIISSGTIGLLWRKFRALWRQKNIYIELFAMGVIVHLVMIGCGLLLLSDKILLTIRTIALPIILIYSPGTMLLGILLLRQSNNFQNRLTKEKLHGSERRLGQIFKDCNIVFIILDPSGSVVFCNKYLLDITKYSEEEVIHQNWFDLFIPEDLRNERKNAFDNRLIDKLNDEQSENEIHTKNGDLVFILWHFTLLRDEKNGVTGIACIGVNITERKNYELNLYDKNKEIEAQNEEYQQINEDLGQTNIELIKAKEKAEESDWLKSAFLANMSHEIRTPMNGILGFADLLQEPGLTGEEQQEYIKIIKKSGAHMLNTINDIIDISKIESGLMKVDIKESNINEQIEYIYTFFKPEVESKGMQLFFKNSLPAKEAVIKTDREKIYAILTNLVKNAIKYSDKGTIEFGYNLKTESKPAELLFFVKDTGIGIPQNKQETIFGRFVQADIADKRAFQGAGLGLSITKAYVEMLGGRVWVESEEGKGSTFYFTISYNAEPQKETAIKNVDSREVVAHQDKNWKILIAEDDEMSEMLLTRIVNKYCKEVLHVRTGLEAIETCLNNPDIDLILMDIQMPQMDGYEATGRIRQFNKTVVIIAQTANVLTGEREKAIESGCNDYISKPFNQALLIELIKKYFNKLEYETGIKN